MDACQTPGMRPSSLTMNMRSVITVILVLACIGLAGVLIFTQKEHVTKQAEATERITALSNNVFQTTVDLDQERQVNVKIREELEMRRGQVSGLSNRLSETTTVLSQTEQSLKQTEESLKTTQAEVAKRESRIGELESQNQALDRRALDLSTAITNLTAEIEQTTAKLAASEGDKAFLEKELQRLIAEKTELEKQFNDIAVLRAQVAKLKEELNVSRRLEWIRQGLFTRAEQKGAEQLIQKEPLGSRPARPPVYELNVEVGADGTVRVIPPSTNSPATSSPPATVP